MENGEFKLNSKVLFDRIEEIKKNPPPEILAYKAAHPEFKAVNCALIAAYIGLSEKTLTNLKLGKLTDSNCSTIGMICMALGLDPRDVFGMPKKSECDPETCSSHTQARLNEKRQRISELEALYKDADARLVNLRTIIRDQSKQLGAAEARAEGLERVIVEKDACIARRDAGIKRRNRILMGVAAAWILVLLVDILLAHYGWFGFGPIK